MSLDSTSSPYRFLFLLAAGAALAALLMFGGVDGAPKTDEPLAPQNDPATYDETYARAIFAGGCFWCMEPPYEKIDGVQATISGYIGGTQPNPTYQQVSSGRTEYTEAIIVIYDPLKVDYQHLLEVFWHNIDPTVENRQFCDWGTQYRTGIFPLDAEQRQLAEASKNALVASGRFPQVVTEITDAGTFYPAEEYHQDFYLKSTAHYKRYRQGCGRDQRLAELWGEEAGGH